MTASVAGAVVALQGVGGSLSANTWLVAIVALTHTQIAAFLTGSTTLATIGEGISMATGDERHERLVRALVRAWAYVFSFGSAIAIFFVLFVLLGVWGRFFVPLSQITFVAFAIEAGTFIAEVVLLYTLYANWERLRPFRKARLGLLILLNLAQWWQMFFINVVASFMLTPNGGDDSVLRQLLNPTDLPLTLHRTIGNIAWAGAVITAVAGFQYLRVTHRARQPATASAGQPLRSVGAMANEEQAPQPEEQRSGPGGESPESEGQRSPDTASDVAYWDWAGQWGLLWAFGLTLLQPWIGYSYAKEVQLHSYDSWYSMMFGELSNTFVLQLGLLGLIFILGTLYFSRRLHASRVRVWRRHLAVTVLLVLTTLFAVQPAWFASTYQDIVASHQDRPWWNGGLRNPLGDFIPWKVLSLFVMVLVGVYAISSFLRARQRGQILMGDARRGSQALLIGTGATVVVMMAVMGVIRESSRAPYLIHGELTIQHQAPAAAPSAPPVLP